MPRKKRVLITGGAGFIGSHLSDYLIKKGYFVIIFDNLLTGSLANVRHLLRDKSFRFEKHDVSKFINVKGNIDYVLHFASPASPIDYEKFPIQTLKVGALGTHNALGVAKKKRARFLLASTSEVYGDPLVHPQKETYWGNVNPVGPRGVYDEAKRYAEALVMAYHRVHAVDAKIVRIFNTYGERMRLEDGRAIPNFITQALRNRDLTVFGSGSQTRSFCYISDMVRGLYRLIRSPLNEPVNIGNPGEYSVLELARAIKKLCGSSGRIVFKALPIDDPKVRQPDIAKARKHLSWKPDVSLHEGLKRTIAWFRTQL
ncbi:MAG: UDP-glucuronic acid decarboxylase family protein [Candidatus Omnitrophota bacterium]